VRIRPTQRKLLILSFLRLALVCRFKIWYHKFGITSETYTSAPFRAFVASSRVNFTFTFTCTRKYSPKQLLDIYIDNTYKVGLVAECNPFGINICELLNVVYSGILTDGWTDTHVCKRIGRQTEVETNGVQAGDGQIYLTH